MATIAQEYIQQGVKQGIEQGIEQGVEQSILRILRRRFGVLPPEVQKNLDGLTIFELEFLLDKAVVVTSLEEFMVQ